MAELRALSSAGGRLACVVLVHTDPPQVRRLLGALAPLPVFLHCDVTTPGDVHAAIVRDLPPHCTLLPRIHTGWARWENVLAELAGHAAALERPEVTHVVTLTGSDYPLVHAEDLDAYVATQRGRSFGLFRTMPVAEWGPDGGFGRVRYRHVPVGRRMVRLPGRRRLPPDLVPAGGSQVKLLAREHIRAVLDTVLRRPDLTEFWRHVWIPDESFIPSVLLSPALVPGFDRERIRRELWYWHWEPGTKSPAWIRPDHLAALRSFADPAGPGALFARKFGSAVNADVLDAVDAELRRPGRIAGAPHA